MQLPLDEALPVNITLESGGQGRAANLMGSSNYLWRTYSYSDILSGGQKTR